MSKESKIDDGVRTNGCKYGRENPNRRRSETVFSDKKMSEIFPRVQSAPPKPNRSFIYSAPPDRSSIRLGTDAGLQRHRYASLPSGGGRSFASHSKNLNGYEQFIHKDLVKTPRRYERLEKLERQEGLQRMLPIPPKPGPGHYSSPNINNKTTSADQLRRMWATEQSLSRESKTNNKLINVTQDQPLMRSASQRVMAQNRSASASANIQESCGTPYRSNFRKDRSNADVNITPNLTSQAQDTGLCASRRLLDQSSLKNGNDRHIVETAYVSREAVVLLLSPGAKSKCGVNLTLRNELEDQSDCESTSVLIMSVGLLTCVMSVYLSYSKGRSYHYDSAVISGVSCTVAAASRSLKNAWVGFGLAGLSTLTCIGLLAIMLRSPKPGTSLHDFTAGVLCGISLLETFLTILALLCPSLFLSRVTIYNTRRKTGARASRFRP